MADTLSNSIDYYANQSLAKQIRRKQTDAKSTLTQSHSVSAQANTIWKTIILTLIRMKTDFPQFVTFPRAIKSHTLSTEVELIRVKRFVAFYKTKSLFINTWAVSFTEHSILVVWRPFFAWNFLFFRSIPIRWPFEIVHVCSTGDSWNAWAMVSPFIDLPARVTRNRRCSNVFLFELWISQFAHISSLLAWARARARAYHFVSAKRRSSCSIVHQSGLMGFNKCAIGMTCLCCAHAYFHTGWGNKRAICCRSDREWERVNKRRKKLKTVSSESLMPFSPFASQCLFMFGNGFCVADKRNEQTECLNRWVGQREASVAHVHVVS